MRTILMNRLVEMIWKQIYLCSFLMLFFNSVSAYQHDQSKVEFLDYSPELLKEYTDGEKALFLLFSAEWCHWCKVLESKTLREERFISTSTAILSISSSMPISITGSI